MRIKAVGEVTENKGDGRHLKVDWTEVDPPREWFFYTNLKTVWKVQQGAGAQPDAADALIQFTLSDKRQDIDRFKNLPYWKRRFGSPSDDDQRFEWTSLYETIADKLTQYREKQEQLIGGLTEIVVQQGKGNWLSDSYNDGSEGFLREVCPFTTIGCFNINKDEVGIRQTVVNSLS